MAIEVDGPVLGKAMDGPEFNALMDRDLGKEMFEDLKGFWDALAEYMLDDGPEPEGLLAPYCGCEDCNARETLNRLIPRMRLLVLAELSAVLDAEGGTQMNGFDTHSVEMFLRKAARTLNEAVPEA